MGWLANRQIRMLSAQLHEMELRLKASEERLAAERAVNADYDRCLDEAMSVIAASDETLQKQHAVIDTLKATIESYQEILDKQAKPLCEGILALLGGRDKQAAFVLDE